MFSSWQNKQQQQKSCNVECNSKLFQFLLKSELGCHVVKIDEPTSNGLKELL